jgi:hypothetical protein
VDVDDDETIAQELEDSTDTETSMRMGETCWLDHLALLRKV